MADGGVLVIGIGNPLRGDDGVGWWLAAKAERLQPAIRVLTVQQLTPELAEELAPCRRVLFVDAWLAGAHSPPAVQASQAARIGSTPGSGAASRGERGPQPQLRRLLPTAPEGKGEHRSHQLDPLQLLAISGLLHGRTPVAWQLLVPAFALAHGDTFSPAMRQLLPQAEALLRRWHGSACGAEAHA